MGGNARHSTIQILASGLPRANSSGPVRCPRLQLRGSAGFAPASQSSLSKEDARTSFQKQEECTCFQPGKSIARRKSGFTTETQRHGEKKTGEALLLLSAPRCRRGDCSSCVRAALESA